MEPASLSCLIAGFLFRDKSEPVIFRQFVPLRQQDNGISSRESDKRSAAVLSLCVSAKAAVYLFVCLFGCIFQPVGHSHSAVESSS